MSGLPKRHDLLHQLQRLDGGLAGEVEQALGRVDLAAHAVRDRRQRTPAMRNRRSRPTARPWSRRSSWRRRGNRPRSRARRRRRPALPVMPECQPDADHVEQERPAIELAVDRAFLADRRDDVVDHFLRDVIVPGLDDVGLDERRHFDERRLPDIDVPGALLVLGLGDEALDAETLDRRDLIVDAGEFRVHRRECRDGDPGSIGRTSASAADPPPAPTRCRIFATAADAGQAEPRDQTAREEFAPVDATCAQARGARLPARCIPVRSVHSFQPPWFGPCWDIGQTTRRTDCRCATRRSATPLERQRSRRWQPKRCVELNPLIEVSTTYRLTLSASGWTASDTWLTGQARDFAEFSAPRRSPSGSCRPM